MRAKPDNLTARAAHDPCSCIARTLARLDSKPACGSVYPWSNEFSHKSNGSYKCMWGTRVQRTAGAHRKTFPKNRQVQQCTNRTPFSLAFVCAPDTPMRLARTGQHQVHPRRPTVSQVPRALSAPPALTSAPAPALSPTRRHQPAAGLPRAAPAEPASRRQHARTARRRAPARVLSGAAGMRWACVWQERDSARAE